jgi:phage terminase large subunit-like protein
VSETQDQADDHVQNIAARLESPVLETFYPDLGQRMVGKFGNSKGWRRNRLRTAAGFTVDAIGLDSAARGAKVDDDRPDLLVFDDVDDETDTLALVEKKERLLTRKLLPALAPDAAVLGVQNLVHAESVFARLADGRADYLIDRVVSGPHKAVDGLAYEQRGGRFVITAGEATWAGQDLRRCQEMVDDFGLTAFLAECQQETDARLGGMYDHVEFRHCGRGEVPDLVRVVCWCDPAVTDTDQSDANGIQIDGVAGDGTIYSLFSWEQRSSPLETLKTAARKALEYRAECVGVETDQGGDTWQSVYREACSALVAGGEYPAGTAFPRFRSDKAGAGHGPKAHRQSQVLADYEKGRIVHVTGTHNALERALRRFPRTKPLDLADARYWAWRDLRRDAKVRFF